jgi:hypothetical protein
MRHNSLRPSNCANGWQASLPFLRSVRVEAKPRAGERDGAARLASFGLAAVLTGLPAFALWGALATYQAGAAAKRARDLSDASARPATPLVARSRWSGSTGSNQARKCAPSITPQRLL